jgi:hypothetical protein
VFNLLSPIVVLLLAIGVGIVVYMNSKPTVKPPSNSTIGLNASTLGGLFSLAGNLFSNGGKAAPPSTTSGQSGGSFFPTVNSTDTTAQQDYAISHGVTDLQGNQIIDENTGNALTYGTD